MQIVAGLASRRSFTQGQEREEEEEEDRRPRVRVKVANNWNLRFGQISGRLFPQLGDRGRARAARSMRVFVSVSWVEFARNQNKEEKVTKSVA